MTRKLSYSRPFREGYYASKGGIPKHRNPYLGKDNEKYDDWQLGWESQYYRDVPEEFVKPIPRKR